MDENPSIASCIQAGTEELQEISDAPGIDAERLLLHVLSHSSPDKGKLDGVNSGWLYAHGEESLTTTQQKTFGALVAERKTGKPLAYILGEAEFYGRPFYVNENVLIPRPETENLIDAVLHLLTSPRVLPRQTSPVRRLPKTSRRSPGDPPGESPAADGPFVIADIGTGSGIIAITLALELDLTHPQQPTPYNLIATDISEKALAVAQKNAARHGVLDRIEFIRGDMLKPLNGRKIDLIVSNPPYVPTQEIPSPGKGKVSPDNRGLVFEPKIALDGGPDGQKYIDEIKNAGVPYVMETTGGKLLLT